MKKTLGNRKESIAKNARIRRHQRLMAKCDESAVDAGEGRDDSGHVTSNEPITGGRWWVGADLEFLNELDRSISESSVSAGRPMGRPCQQQPRWSEVRHSRRNYCCNCDPCSLAVLCSMEKTIQQRD